MARLLYVVIRDPGDGVLNSDMQTLQRIAVHVPGIKVLWVSLVIVRLQGHEQQLFSIISGMGLDEHLVSAFRIEAFVL